MLRPPVRLTSRGFVVKLGDQEAELVHRLLGELRGLLTTDDPAAAALTGRLFPVAHPDDPEREAEYQRLMRDELVTSRLASIDVVDEALDAGRPLDEGQLTAFVQSVNALRLVLGTMLGILDDADDPDADPTVDPVPDDKVGTPEHHLYGYLSWLLEHAVRALSGR